MKFRIRIHFSSAAPGYRAYVSKREDGQEGIARDHDPIHLWNTRGEAEAWIDEHPFLVSRMPLEIEQIVACEYCDHIEGATGRRHCPIHIEKAVA